MLLDHKSLPPLNALTVFHIAATSGSFTEAAEKLFVTQGAVSRQIRSLEENIGVSLFDRSVRKVRLTAYGREYHAQIQVALEHIASATKSIKNGSQEQQITIAASHAVASLWLMPKISEYSKAYPDTDIRLLVSDNVLAVNADDVDCRIGYSRDIPTSHKVERLFSERVFVVSSPDFLEQNSDLSPTELLRTRQLVLDNPTLGWFNWPDWFAGMKIPAVVPQHKLTFSHYNMLIQAAQQGRGVALAWDHLVTDYIKSGSLVKVFDTTLETQAGCYFMTSKVGSTKVTLEEFRRWLMDNIMS